MAGITFNLILIRVYKDRLRLTDSNADSGDADGNETLSELQFHTTNSTSNRTMPECQDTHQENEEPCAEQDGDARGDWKPMFALAILLM